MLDLSENGNLTSGICRKRMTDRPRLFSVCSQENKRFCPAFLYCFGRQSSTDVAGRVFKFNRKIKFAELFRSLDLSFGTDFGLVKVKPGRVNHSLD